jgi:hypothetical protein
MIPVGRIRKATTIFSYEIARNETAWSQGTAFIASTYKNIYN